MSNYWKIFIFLGLQFLSVISYAQQIDIMGLRYMANAQKSRLVFDLTAPTQYRVFAMNSPSRLIIDIKNAHLKQSLTQPESSHPLFDRVRAGLKNDTDLRIVVDLKLAMNADNLVFGTNAKDGKHLVIDLFNQEANTLTKNEAPKSAVLEDNKKNTGKSQAASVSDKAITSKIPSRLVIAVDAGHGGEDPGARGPAGTEEKTITFSIAKKLQALINNQPGMKAIMVRKNDYYVSLKDRVRIARAAKANLFVSIHADAVLNADIKGASVYTLSTSGASSEAARWLADSENASDLVDVKLNDKEEVLASVLLDLTQTATQEASVNVANEVLKNFVNVAELHKDSVQKAGFMVLKSPDIPSILVETAFISNASEEVNLLSVQYQTKVANAIFNGIRSYFKQSLPEANVAALGL
ncbi:MAG: AMIN domain-containing protein [Methylococcales bacterium]|nr:MAG: AMIN domain-containing protein [Methylococcales bacterium]